MSPSTLEHPPVRNLVFAGGGVRGMAYTGAVRALGEAGLLSEVTRVAGASAGAITAGMLAMGADQASFEGVSRTLHFPAMIQGFGGILGDLWRLFQGYGFHSGAPMVTWLRQSIATLTEASLGVATPELDFAGLERAKQAGRPVRSLYVVASNLSLGLPTLLCAESTPTLPIWKALRMSASFPFVFEAVRQDGEVFVDGGVSWNYHVDLFDGDADRRTLRAVHLPDEPGRTLGFALGSVSDVANVPTRVNVHDLRSAVSAYARFVLEESTRLHTSRRALERTVILDDLGLSPVDFNITLAQEEELERRGYATTRAWLAANEPG